MKTGSTLLIAILASVITAFAVIHFASPATTLSEHKETSYERVVRTDTLRCGYNYWDGAVMKDDKTGQVYGPWVDIMNALGSSLGLKIEWAEQVGWDDVGAALKANKIDAMCAGMWTSAAKAKEINFSTPLAYQAIEAFVRSDDHRFDAGLNTLNSSAVKIMVIENDNSDFIAQQDYPEAQRVPLGQMYAVDGDLMMNVANGKGDVTFAVTGLWQQYNKNNPGKIRELAPGQKLRVFGLANAINNDDTRLVQMLNAGDDEIRNSGQLDKILDKANHDWPDMYIKGTRPY